MGASEKERLQAWGQVIVSVLVVGGGGWIVFNGDFDDSVTKWATGLIGVVVGYWLR